MVTVPDVVDKKIGAEVTWALIIVVALSLVACQVPMR